MGAAERIRGIIRGMIRIVLLQRMREKARMQRDIAGAQLQLNKLKELKKSIRVFYKDYIKPRSSDPMEEIVLSPIRAEKAAKKANEIFAQISRIERITNASSEKLEKMINNFSFAPSVGEEFRKDLALEGMIKNNLLHLKAAFERAVSHMKRTGERGHITKFFDLILGKLIEEEIAMAEEELKGMEGALRKAA